MRDLGDGRRPNHCPLDRQFEGRRGRTLGEPADEEGRCVGPEGRQFGRIDFDRGRG